MEPMKSQVDFYVDLFELLLRCDPSGLASLSSIRKDVETMSYRTSKEGLSFLTKTLPKLGKALDSSLTSGSFLIPSEFKRSYRNHNIPAFMQAYFNELFDANGLLREDASPDVVSHIRQVCYFAYKLELPYTESQKSAVLDSFVETDGNLAYENDKDSLEILEVASFIISDIFKDFDPMEISPRHGPGSVATGEKLEEKWTFRRLYDSIHQTYPYYDYFMVGWDRELTDRLDWYQSLVRMPFGTAKVILVPKDSRGPRLISCEPLEYQWVQQGLGRKIMSHLESHYMTSGRVNFASQSINQKLALSSSLDGAYATLDMKDASDRVSSTLVRALFKRVPLLLRCLEACRSSATLLPDGRVVELQKYAPMGSALCFPIEAVCFWALLVASVSRSLKIKQKFVREHIYVYGDDIILPTEYADMSIQHLERFALLVNRSKCCITGNFRESCGTDAFKGKSVTPKRLKIAWSGSRTDGSAYTSYVSLANRLCSTYKLCSDYMWSQLEEVYGKIPYGTILSSVPCRVVDDPDVAEELNSRLFRRRRSRRYQRFEFLVPSIYSNRRKSKLDGWTRLLRNLLVPPFGDPSEVVVPRSTIIKRGWTATY